MCGESIRRKEARRLNGKMNDWRLPCPLSFPFFPVLISFCNQKFTKSLKRERERDRGNRGPREIDARADSRRQRCTMSPHFLTSAHGSTSRFDAFLRQLLPLRAPLSTPPSIQIGKGRTLRPLWNKNVYAWARGGFGATISRSYGNRKGTRFAYQLYSPRISPSMIDRKIQRF